nr:VacJ family lipoprotein [Burkholderiaceae bacterium]
IGNAFSNIEDVPTALNNLLQGKLARAATDVCRFVVNSTVGLLGCFDVASQIGMDKGSEDFGQTLGVWGLEPGPYFVWPLLGPSTVRDSLGRVAGFYTDPVDYIDHVPTRNTLIGVRIVDSRATLLRAEKLVDRAALDRYQFIRDAYLQRRRNLVHDGSPPPGPGQEGGGEGTGAINPYEDPEDLDEPAPPPASPVIEPAAQPAPAPAQPSSAPPVTSRNKNSTPTPSHTAPQDAHKAL